MEKIHGIPNGEAPFQLGGEVAELEIPPAVEVTMPAGLEKYAGAVARAFTKTLALEELKCCR